jgi:hypothetical protein
MLSHFQDLVSDQNAKAGVRQLKVPKKASDVGNNLQVGVFLAGIVGQLCALYDFADHALSQFLEISSLNFIDLDETLSKQSLVIKRGGDGKQRTLFQRMTLSCKYNN